jgi:surface protein
MSKSIYDKLNLINQETDKIKTMLVNSKQLTAEEATLENIPPAIQAIIEAGGGSVEANPYEELFNARTNGGNYAYLLSYCNAKSLDVSNLDTSNVTDMKNMFYNCRALTSLDVSNFNTSKVKNMSYMFGFCNLLALLEGLNNFNTNNVTDMSQMFNSCNNLATLDLSSFDTSKVTNMSSMFYYCTNLTSLDVSSFDTSNLTNMSGIFQSCVKLTSLDLSNWDVSKVTASYAVSNAFYTCSELTDFKAPKNISGAFNFVSCTKLTHDSLMSIINNLTTKTSTTKLTLGATNLAKLTNEEKAIATNKGWTLA